MTPQLNSESEYVQQRISPPFQEWAALIVETQPLPVIESAGTTETAQPIDSSTTVDALRRSARRRFIECAQAYVMRLTDLAERAGISLSRVPLLTGDPDQQPIVMTGHQPTIFHSGLTFKYEVTESFAVETNAIFAAVVIDTDAGDCGRFELPESVGDSVFDVAASARSLAAKHDPSLFLAVPMQSEDQLLQLSQVVDEQMKRLAARTSHRWMSGPGHVLREYAKLAGPDAGISMMDANLILRWRFGIGARSLELPISSIAAFPEVVALTRRLVCRGQRFASE